MSRPATLVLARTGVLAHPRGMPTSQVMWSLPSSAPDLFAAEGVWHLLQRGERKHRRCHDRNELRWNLDLAIRRLGRTAHRFPAFFRPCGCVHELMQRSVISRSAVR